VGSKCSQRTHFRSIRCLTCSGLLPPSSPLNSTLCSYTVLAHYTQGAPSGAVNSTLCSYTVLAHYTQGAPPGAGDHFRLPRVRVNAQRCAGDQPFRLERQHESAWGATRACAGMVLGGGDGFHPRRGKSCDVCCYERCDVCCYERCDVCCYERCDVCCYERCDVCCYERCDVCCYERCDVCCYERCNVCCYERCDVCCCVLLQLECCVDVQLQFHLVQYNAPSIANALF
jgi:hypothetical protein